MTSWSEGGGAERVEDMVETVWGSIGEAYVYRSRQRVEDGTTRFVVVQITFGDDQPERSLAELAHRYAVAHGKLQGPLGSAWCFGARHGLWTPLGGWRQSQTYRDRGALAAEGTSSYSRPQRHECVHRHPTTRAND